MKVVLFCGGLGTRIREYSEAIPKPLIPVGNQPILWHGMKYYSHFGHNDFVLCLGYKASTIKDYFLNLKPQTYTDCIVSTGSREVEMIGKGDPDWRIALMDTGVWRNIGERLWAVREHVQDEEFFFANYSDGLSNVNLSDMVDAWRRSKKIACFLAVKPPLNYHFLDLDTTGQVRGLKSWRETELWINGGFFIFSPRIFDYMRPGEELVDQPFRRLAEDGQLLAYKYDGFWRAMDTLRDRQVLEDMVEQGQMPWRLDLLEGGAR